MTSPTAEIMLTPALVRELRALHPRQRRAVLQDGSLVVLAGPGSGKTRTLVARVGYLLAVTSEHRGVAAITYTDAAATELVARLKGLGYVGNRRLASRTVHSFCRQHILRPYGHLVGAPQLADLRVLGRAEVVRLWTDAMVAAGLPAEYNREQHTLAKIRRLLAAEQSVAGYQAGHIKAVHGYEKALRQANAIDFDAMTSWALVIMRKSQTAGELLVARFPNVVIDEYQDLGPVLHALVQELMSAGVKITAVGDPDQTLFGYQGADPSYLLELPKLIGREAIRLALNYRSGSAIVAAARGALGEDRGYHHNPERADPGIIDIQPVQGGLDAHARHTAEAAASLIANGVRPEGIAILYPGQTELHRLIEQELTQQGINFDAERGRRVPDSPVSALVGGCAARRLSGPLPGPAQDDHGDRRPISTARELAAQLGQLRSTRGLSTPEETVRSLARLLIPVLDAPDRPGREDACGPFLGELLRALDAAALTANTDDQRDVEAYQILTEEASCRMSMAELAGGRAPGHVALTTYHSAKGREFAAVILPGLIDGLIPFYRRDSQPTTTELANARQAFYVAFTRAADAVILLPGSTFRHYNQVRTTKWSRFIDDIQAELKAAAG
ncbi:ATP-dependent helicase [Micromonospora radicis]|uniref:DNA 3'-5' helicase n=1 Tax=Micromonospora radicis TaxID=1894971 RepID=A0A418MMM2_9ACTN|nr:ATP-dependent helicase [Micromonospora radicis]RIV29818.1 ATP-dependent helicase [Micromonospora radicis]